MGRIFDTPIALMLPQLSKVPSRAMSNLIASSDKNREAIDRTNVLHAQSLMLSYVTDRSAPTLVWTGKSEWIEDDLYGPCPHTISYASKYNGYQILRGAMVTNEATQAKPWEANQSHPFLKLMSTFMSESRSGEQGGAILPDFRALPQLPGSSSGQNQQIALNGFKANNLLAAADTDSDALALATVKDLGLQYSLEGNVKLLKNADVVER